MKKSLAMTCFGLLMTVGAQAQETPRFSFDLGAGFTTPVSGANSYLDTGFNIQGGVGFNFSSYVGAMLDFDYNQMGINSGTLSNLGFPGGGVHVFSATVDPIIHLNPKGHFDFYITGGGGLYHYYQDFTQPSVATFTEFNPLFGGFFPVAVPTTEILSSYSINKPGIDAGAGLAFGNKWHGKFFAEARWDRIFVTSNRHVDYIPVTFPLVTAEWRAHSLSTAFTLL